MFEYPEKNESAFSFYLYSPHCVSPFFVIKLDQRGNHLTIIFMS